MKHAVRIDVFTNEVGKGNPAAIIDDGDILSNEEMQLLAKKIWFNETVFICSSECAKKN